MAPTTPTSAMMAAISSVVLNHLSFIALTLPQEIAR
jgi:hypothetical protein